MIKREENRDGTIQRCTLASSLWCALLLLLLVGRGVSGQVLTNLAFTKIRADTNGLFLQWDGAYPPFTLEHTTTPHRPESWQSVPIYPNDNACRLPPSALKGFYRVRGTTNPPWGTYLGQWLTLESQFPTRGLLGRHRLKSIWDLHESPACSPRTNALAFFHSIIVKLQYMEDAELITRIGSLSSFPNASLITSNNNLLVSWQTGAGPSQRHYALSLAFPYPMSSQRTNVHISDPYIELSCAYATPQIDLFHDLTIGTTTSDSAGLVQLLLRPSDRLISISFSNASMCSSMTGGIVFYEGSTSNYVSPTSALGHWNHTTFTGVTSLPFTLASPFAQTYYATRHNFEETLLFEPEKDPLLSSAIKAELKSINMRFIVVYYTWMDPSLSRMHAIGFDNSIRQLH